MLSIHRQKDQYLHLVLGDRKDGVLCLEALKAGCVWISGKSGFHFYSRPSNFLSDHFPIFPQRQREIAFLNTHISDLCLPRQFAC